MGRKERKRYDDNTKVREIIEKENDNITIEEIEFIKEAYTGVGGLNPSGWNNGQFFTPSVVTKFLVDFMGIRSGRVLEPSCGGGAFIAALPEECSITGVEYMIETARVAELCYPHATILQGDTLETTFEEPFDYVIGNPPYGLNATNWDFDCGKKLKSEVAFIEHGLRHLKVGGILGMVIPDSILANKREEAWRKHMMEHHKLLAVISLPSQTFYHVGTSVKTSVIVIQKGIKMTDEDKVFMALCKDIGWDSRGKPINKCDLVPIMDEWMSSGLSPHRTLAPATVLEMDLVESKQGIDGQLALAI